MSSSVENHSWSDADGDFIEVSQNWNLKVWYINGKLWKQEQYENGRLIKEREFFIPIIQYTFWNSRGRKIMESCRKGKRNTREGERKEWENGNLVVQMFYKNNLLNGKYKEWYADGKLKIYACYRNNKLDGKIKSWHDNGHPNVERMFNLSHDAFDGERKEWNRNGKVIIHEYYIEGELFDPQFSHGRKCAMINAKRCLYLRRILPSLNSHMILDLSKMVCKYISG